MTEEGCVVAYSKKRFRYSSYKGEIGDASKNMVDWNFHASAPNRLWLTYVTQLSIPVGKVYLSPIIDVFDGMPVSWTIRTSPSAEIANTMRKDACRSLADGETPVIHGDRGCHCRWPGWLRICRDYGLVRSMSRKGRSPDNSAMEGFSGGSRMSFSTAGTGMVSALTSSCSCWMDT